MSQPHRCPQSSPRIDSLTFRGYHLTVVVQETHRGYRLEEEPGLQETMRESPRGTAEEVPGPKTLTDWLRARFAGVLEPVAERLAGIGMGANAISVLGFLLQVGVGLLFVGGRVRVGGLILFFGAPLDALDGAVARASGRDGMFGAFLDSTLDRFADAVLILGLVAYRMQAGAHVEVALLLAALVAAFMVSYTRARAESLGASCKVGLLTRLERILLIAVLAAFGLITILAWALAILSAFTVLQRVVYVYASCFEDD